MWPFPKRTVPADDIAEAQQMRAVSSEQLRQVDRRGPGITQLAGYLAERREQNHFGELIQITFTPRRNT